MRRLRWPALVAIVVIAALSRTLALADARAGEYEIKAAFLCKFGNYVEWPSGAGAPAEGRFTIGVAGSDEVVDEVARTAQGQTVNGQPIAVRRIAPGAPIDGVAILFVARPRAARVAEILAAVRGRPILTVTEVEPGSPTIGMVNFLIVDDKIKFDVSLAAAEASNIRISARLLGVAHAVSGRES